MWGPGGERGSEGLIPTAPNHPRSIGTCSIGIQVSRGSHKMAASVIGNGKRGWTLGVSCCFVVFLSPSLPLLAPRTMPTRTIHALCSDKRIIIKGDEVIGSKQQEDSIVVGCTLTDSQRAIRCCVCSCHRSLITLEESAPVRYFTQTKGRADRVKRVSYLKVLFVGFFFFFVTGAADGVSSTFILTSFTV